MRGLPLAKAGLIFIALLLFGFPIWKITADKSVQAQQISKSEDQPENVRVKLTFAHVPLNFKVSHLGEVIWQSTTPQSAQEKTFPIPFPKEGIELVIEAQWPEEISVTAVKIETLSPVPDEKTVWSQGNHLETVISFP